jgi:hypothetical protein
LRNVTSHPASVRRSLNDGPVALALLGLAAGMVMPCEARAQSSAASPTPPVAGYVVVDLTANPKDTSTVQIVSFPHKTVTSSNTTIDCAKIQAPVATAPAAGGVAPPGYVLGDLARLVACAADGRQAIDRRAAAASHVKGVAQAFAKSGTPRLITDAGEVLNVVVIDRAQAFSLEGAAQPFAVRGRKPKVTFEEKARETQLASDLRSLVRVAAGIGGAEAGAADFDISKIVAPQPVDWAHVFPQTLLLRRATVTVTAEPGKADSILQAKGGLSVEAAAQVIERWEAAQVQDVACTSTGLPDETKVRSTPLAVLTCRARSTADAQLRVSAVEALGTLGDPRAASLLTKVSSEAAQSGDLRLGTAALTSLSRLRVAPAAPAAAPADESVKPKAELRTGPAEHWFLSADVPLNTVQALTFDDDTGQVTLGDEPSAFYVGVNFLLGDIKETRRPFLGNVVLKVMLKASRNPLDSVGLAVGLRGQFLTKWGLDLDALTPFVAWTWSEEDVAADGVVQRRARRNSEFRYGLSLNLDQAVKWFGGK